MKIINEKGKIFGLVNLIDLLIVLAAVLCVFAAYKILEDRISVGGERASEVIVVEIKQKEDIFCRDIKQNVPIYDRTDNKQIGTLVEAQVKPSTSYTNSLIDGTVSEVSVPDRSDVLLTIALDTDTEMYVGKYISVNTKEFMGAGYIINMEKDD